MGSSAKMAFEVLELMEIVEMAQAVHAVGVHWHLANVHACFLTFEIAGNHFVGPSGVSWSLLRVPFQPGEPVQTAH